MTLQFYNLANAQMASLTDFDLLIYFALRERTKTKMEDLFEESLRQVCGKIDASCAVRGAMNLKTLFLIDGYDECNHESSILLEDIMGRIRNSACRAIVTTHYHAADNLMTSLNQFSLSAKEYTIEKIFRLNDQIEFLKNYDRSVNNIQNSDEVETAFQSLEADMQSVFDQPFMLVLFCNFVWSCPERIHKW